MHGFKHIYKHSVIFPLAILAVAILWAGVGLRTAGTENFVSATRQITAPMPNLDGEKAKDYLDKEGLSESLGEAIETARYSVGRVANAPVSNQGATFEAKNPQQNFAAYFSNDGVDLVSREAGGNWNLSLQLKSVGRGVEQLAVGNKQWTVDKTKVSASHRIRSEISNLELNVVEWFENRPEGLEQSFVIQENIKAEDPHTEDRSLKLVLSVSGDLQPEISDDRQAMVFTKAGISVLRYDKLKSWDANGEELASRMELNGSELSLVVDDADATYPITIDPTFTQVKKLLASDGGTNDAFGFSVAVSGNTAIVGAFNHTPSNIFQAGAAYIFERNTGGTNNWSQVKKLTASDAANFDEFGFAVAIQGDTIIVGAPDESAFSNSAGAIYIFERNAGGANNWGQVRKRTPSDGAVNDYFGHRISLSGDTVVVGAPKVMGSKTAPGAAYILERDAGGAGNWGQIKKIEASDSAPDNQFGWAVGISGDTVIIGSLGNGGAYIYERDSGGQDNWGEVIKLTSSDGPGGIFGYATAIDGDRAIVSAYYRTVGSNFAQGAAYIYERNAGGADNWGEVKRIVASDGATQDNFGTSVAVLGDKIIVGAYQDDIGTTVDQGSAYVFERNAGGANNWGQVKKLFAPDGIEYDFFGWAIALDGNTAIVGARAAGINQNTGRGSAYVFVRTNTSWVQETKPLPANCTVEDYFGYSVAISGNTAIVGTPNEDVGSNANQGAVYIFERDAGGTNNWGSVKTIAATDGIANAYFGWSVGVSGDTAVVGVYADDTGAITTKAAAYLFERNSGGANNWGQVKKLTASDGAVGDLFGFSVAVSGSAAIVGAILDDVGASNAQGSAYIFERNAGGADNWGEVKHIVASDGAVVDTFGKSVAISGDTAIVGSDGDDIGANTNQGSAYIFERNNGGPGNWGELKKIKASDGAATDQFGYSVAIDGNTIIVGAWQDKVGANVDQGSAYIFERNTGGANNWGQVKRLIAADGAAADFFGLSVAVSGDTAVVGSVYDQVGANTFQGSAYIFKQNTGGASNWGQVKKLIAADGATNDFFGRSVAISGDTVIGGAVGNTVGGAIGQGSAYIFVSNNDAWDQQANISPPAPTNCGAADNYGSSVAVSGDTAVIGAPGDDVGINTNQGTVYILERNQGGANNWGLVKLLTASDGAANDLFGHSVAISGNSVIIGADGGPSTTSSPGSAYIFERNNGGTNNFGEVKKLTASDGVIGDRLGWSVAINGNTAVAGATEDNNSQGSAYIYDRNAGGANNWGEVKKLTDAAGATSDFFGWSVAVKNDTIFVSSPGDDIGINTSQGSVHIFERNAGGANFWARTKYLTVADGAFGDSFGWALAVSGNLLIVSAPIDGIADFTGEGSAYIFERNTGGADNWGQVKKIRAADAGQQDQFGRAVGISGDALIVGSPLDDVNGKVNQGSAHIFEQNAGGANNWGQVFKLTANDGAADDWFGSAVAVSGDTFLVGAYLASAPAFTEKQSENLLGGNTKGASYVFRGGNLAPTAASVSVAGRVMTVDGHGVPNARVILNDANGSTRSVITNPFGYYRFDEVQAGTTYIFSVTHKRYQFAPVAFTINDEVRELNFTAER